MIASSVGMLISYFFEQKFASEISAKFVFDFLSLLMPDTHGLQTTFFEKYLSLIMNYQISICFQALDATDTLKNAVDTLIVIPNDRLLKGMIVLKWKMQKLF